MPAMPETPGPVRIGYLIPQFPAQTHIFFWRELEELRRLGVEADLVSTRPPPARLVSHVWARAAAERTFYLFPPRWPAALRAAGTLLRAGPHRWLRCLRLVSAGGGPRAGLSSWRRRLHLLGLCAVGAHLGWRGRRRGWAHLHVHSCGDAANLALFANLLTDLPYSLTLHGPLADYGAGQPEKWGHARFALVITRKLLGEVQMALKDRLPVDLGVAPMGVDLRQVVRPSPYLPYRGEGPFRIVSCGRLNPCKGHDDLIRAVALARGRGREVRLSIAGEDDTGGRCRAELQDLIDQLGLRQQVELLGALSEPAVLAALAGAHCFSLASLHEPLGVATMEAMAMSLPVVVTGAGGVKELVDDGQDGLLVEPRAPASLAAALERVASDPELAVRLGRAARSKIERSFHSGVGAGALARRLGAPMTGATESGHAVGPH
jgi:glycosyltransferase involved in cell wall biosynthesis